MASLLAKMAAQAKEAATTAATKAATTAATKAATSVAEKAKAQVTGTTSVANNIQNVGTDPNVNPFAKNNPVPPPAPAET